MSPWGACLNFWKSNLLAPVVDSSKVNAGILMRVKVVQAPKLGGSKGPGSPFPLKTVESSVKLFKLGIGQLALVPSTKPWIHPTHPSGLAFCSLFQCLLHQSVKQR